MWKRWLPGSGNPFDLAFDGTGRLLAIDNDPDSRGPNRLIDVVEEGDYGYKITVWGKRHSSLFSVERRVARGRYLTLWVWVKRLPACWTHVTQHFLPLTITAY